MQQEREKESVDNLSQTPDAPEAVLVLSRGWWDSRGQTVTSSVKQVNRRENRESNPQHPSREKGKTKNTDVLSLGFAAGGKEPIWI